MIPAFDELDEIPELGLRHAWGVFGADDVLGTINLLTPQKVLNAVGLVRTGEVVSLNLPLNQPDPPLFGRAPYRHEVFALNRNEMDDRLDGLHPQGSSQWDGLAHVRCREFGYWGGRRDDPATAKNDLGIEHWAEHGIVGRGVLVDIPRWSSRQGGVIDALGDRMLTAAELADALASQQTELEEGDVLLVRTGWLTAYRRLTQSERASIAAAPTSIGLRADEEMARFLWNAHVAALCCDNPAIEIPRGDPVIGSLHRRLLPLLGMALGELFDLDVLAERCAALGRWSFLFVASPMALPGGLGSPANALAIL